MLDKQRQCDSGETNAGFLNMELSKRATVIAVAVIAVLGCGVIFASAWTEPTGTPPTNNVAAPINAGATAQGKMGSLGIGTISPTSKLQVVGLPVYANNAAAMAGGLTAGAFYRTGADPDHLCIVH